MKFIRSLPPNIMSILRTELMKKKKGKLLMDADLNEMLDLTT